MGIERHRREKDHNRLMQRVGGFDRHVEPGIVQRPLGTLHPVNDAAAAGIRSAWAADGHAWIGRERFQFRHDRKEEDLTQ